MTDAARPRVLVRETIADAGVDLLRERFDVDVDLDGDLAAIIGGYDALIVRSATKVSRELIEQATRLRVIGRAGVGVDNVDLDAASERGIVVANAPQSTVVSAAEHTLGLLLSLARNIPQAHAALTEGRWERSRFGGLELAGKTLGLVGFGRIGQQVARRAAGLEMQVAAYDPFVAPERFRAAGVTRSESLAELLGDSDFLSLHLTLTPETTGIVGREALGAAKQGIRIVNVARGELVDEEALIEALESGVVAGAALDVFSAEPYSGPLLGRPNVIVTPHLGASTGEAQDRAGVIVAEQVVAALDGGPVTNAVNMPAVGAEDLEVLRPYLPLAGDLAGLACGLAGGSPARLELVYLGQLAVRDTRLLTVAALNGLFKGRVEQPVNYVNAPVIARERGIEVRESTSSASADYTSLIEVTAYDESGEGFSVAGTTIGRDSRRQVVRALDYEIDVELSRSMLFAENDDRPGMIGRVGTIMGEAGINIANMAVSRNRPEARALMALSLDSPVPDDVLELLRGEPGILAARFVALPGMSWPPEVERVARTLKDASVEARLEEFPEGTPTAAAAAAAVGADLGDIVKSLLFACDGRWTLAMVPGDRRADRAKVAAAAGAQRAAVASAHEVARVTGFEAGGVAPFPLPGVHTVLIEQTLLARAVLWIGAGTPRHMAALAPGDLVKVSRAQSADLVSENGD